MRANISLILTVTLLLSASLLGQTEQPQGKNPIIVIPGILGSKLVNKVTNQPAWVRFTRAAPDDLGLPITPNLAANRDNLEATDIIDKVKIVKFLPGISIYEDLLEYLEKKLGYRRVSWETARSGDDQDTFYVFAYDWRRDNVENSQLLLQKIDRLKATLKKPNLKFDVLAHSMGGLIARYAVMYGPADLAAKPTPNWSGAKYFNKIFLLGTPNEGSMGALDTLCDGYSIESLAGRIYPEFLNREVGFTIPALFQLLPHGASARFYDENLKPLDLDIYDVKTWKKYGWALTTEAAFMEKLSKSKKIQAEKYFEAVLLRAKGFHEALDVKTRVPDSIKFYLFGSDCKNTLEGAIVFFDMETGKWRTLMQSDSFKTVRGEKVSEKSVKQTIFAKGDGAVTKRSLLGETISEANAQNLFAGESLSPPQKIICDDHTTLPGNKIIQQNLTTILTSKPPR